MAEFVIVYPYLFLIGPKLDGRVQMSRCRCLSECSHYDMKILALGICYPRRNGEQETNKKVCIEDIFKQDPGSSRATGGRIEGGQRGRNVSQTTDFCMFIVNELAIPSLCVLLRIQINGAGAGARDLCLGRKTSRREWLCSCSTSLFMRRINIQVF